MSDETFPFYSQRLRYCCLLHIRQGYVSKQLVFELPGSKLATMNLSLEIPEAFIQLVVNILYMLCDNNKFILGHVLHILLFILGHVLHILLFNI